MTTAIVTPSKFGPMLVPPFDVYLSRAMIANGEYAPDEFETWRPYLRLESVVLDIGANFGAHTFAFADVARFGVVLAIEPQRALFNMLSGSIELTGSANVRAKHCACGRTPGQVFIPPINYAGVGNFGGLELGATTEGDPVARVAIDSWALKHVDFIKIDVEGMELDVLEGARDTIARCRPVLAVEADRPKQVPALLEFLREAGYRAWWHKPPLGDLWPNIISINLLALPAERTDLPEPEGDIEPVAPAA